MIKAPPERQATEQELLLFNALKKRGLGAEMHHWDGHKTIDIAILEARLYIEVDGYNHFTDPKQILSDFKRDHFSDGDDFYTFRIPHNMIKRHLNDVVDAIAEIVKALKTQDVPFSSR